MEDLVVQWLFPDGAGGASLPGRKVARLPGAVPGDRVRWREVGRRGRTVQGEVQEVVQASPDRRTPPCPWDASCGGCDLAALQPGARLHALSRVAQRAFRLSEPPPVVPSPRPTGHRARIKLAFDQGRIGYRAARSHDLVEVETCGIARPEVQQGLARLRRWVAQAAERTQGLASVEIRSDGARVVFALASSGAVPRQVRQDAKELGDVALDGRRLHGEPRLWLEVSGVRLRASPRSFYQVNLEANALLVAHVLQVLEAYQAERVLDLYAGMGNFTLPVAARGFPVVAVEREGQAIEDLQVSAEDAGLTSKVRAVKMPVEAFDPAREPFDVALLDPPRAGAPGVLPRVVRNRPRALIYVSCHAPSASRDLREAGYRVRDVRAFDLFPDTHHFETVVVAERS